jgi:hypothetical protein
MAKGVTQLSNAISDGVRALVKKGYPLPVAKRIDSGELPMDDLSRIERADAQGFDFYDSLYHSSLEDLTEFDASFSLENNDMGKGLYATNSIDDARLNYSLNSEDMLAKVQFEMNEGSTNGAVYELLRKKEIPNINDPIVDEDQANEFIEAAKSQLNEADYEEHDDYLDAIDYLTEAMVLETPQGQRIAKAAGDMGYKVNLYAGETTWADLRKQIGTQMQDGNTLSTSEGYLRPAGSILQEIMTADGKKGVVDSTTKDRFRNAGEHTIIFPGNENMVRSPNAAFDPEYRGGNMLGNADPRLLTGVAATGIGASALLNNRAPENKPQPSGQTNDRGMMERLAAAQAVHQRGTITNTPMTHREQAKQALVEQGLRDGTISSNYSGQKLANSIDFAADFLPFVGGAAGATDTYDSTVRGHLGQAAIDAGTTLVGAIPGVRKVGKAGRGMFDVARRKAADMRDDRSGRIMADIVEQATKN